MLRVHTLGAGRRRHGVRRGLMPLVNTTNTKKQLEERLHS